MKILGCKLRLEVNFIAAIMDKKNRFTVKSNSNKAWILEVKRIFALRSLALHVANELGESMLDCRRGSKRRWRLILNDNLTMDNIRSTSLKN